LVLVFFFVSTLSFAKDNFPVEPRVEVAEAGSADEAIGFRYTSQPYEKRPEFKGLLRNLYVALGFRMAVVPGVDGDLRAAGAGYGAGVHAAVGERAVGVFAGQAALPSPVGGAGILR